MFIVYKTTCLINNKIYIGVHETENPDIFDGYIGNSINIFNRRWAIEHPSFPFHYAVAKHGIHNFKRETLFVFDTEKAAFDKEEEIVTEEFIKKDDNYNVCVGGKRPRARQSKVYQFDLYGNLLNTYESVVMAAKLNEINYKTLLSTIHSKGCTKDCHWSYESKIDVTDYKHRTYLKYYIYDIDGDFVKEFDTCDEITSFLKTNTGNLSRAVKLNYKINGYFITNEKFDKLQVTVTKLSGKLNRYSLEGEYIDSFKSAGEAKKKTGLKLCSLSQAIKLGRQCNGYYWTRTDNPPKNIDVKKN